MLTIAGHILLMKATVSRVARGQMDASQIIFEPTSLW